MKTLLLAEHHAPTLAHVRAELTQAGYSVIPASDPGSALEAFVAKHPDAVVVAVDFPRLDGAHLGQLIRSHDRGARVPMIAIDKAHLGRAKGVQAILELKVNGYVPDPLKSAELAGKLQQLLASAEQAASTAAQSSGARAVLDRKPISSGELKGHALPALVHSLFRLQRDGVLVVAFKDLTRRAYFLRGGAVNYDSTARQDSFASFLLERQLIQPGEGEALMKALSGGLRIGSALAEAGIRLEGEELLGTLRDYTREKITQLVGMRDGRYAFHAGAEFSTEVPTIEIPTLSAVLEGARRSFPVRQFAQGLKDKLDQFPARTPQFGQDLGAMGLGTQDIKVAMQVNGRLVLRDLIAHGRGELRETYSLFWFLGLTGGVSFSKEPTAAGDAQTYVAADAIAPRKKKPLPPETVRELRDAAVKIITASYFRVLGLSIDADTEAVERAYHEVAAKFHPDSYPGQDTSELQDLLDSVQDKLAASYRVLSSAERRRQYLQYLLGRIDTGRSGEIDLDAELALRRGEAAFKRKDWRGALKAFEEAVSQNPREPEYYSYLAWATYRGGHGPVEERAKAAQKVLRKALGLNPYLERAQIISAIIDADQQDDSSARRKLLKVLELNPHSTLAKAALRRVGR